MECSNCGSPSAQIHTRVVGGDEIQVCLCSECYEKLYAKSDASELFAHLFGSGGEKTKKKKVCPSCGMKLEEFRRSGLLGCTGCYTAFRSEIDHSVRYCQWDAIHRGKEPNGATEEKYELVRELVREQESVKAQIDLAFQAEDYKLVSELKRRLQTIREKLTVAGEV
ncbi:MAG: hypothetical protein K2L02_00355 [Clostridia bacterium]|nr:hypothetical protein [Clostridia bacterium]